MNKLLIVCGPTATGKTALAVTLAKKYNGELVSADSRQVYEGMDIGTGKDLKEKRIVGKVGDLLAYDLDGVPIWMYDVVSPDEPYSVGQYRSDALRVIDDIRKRNKLPIVVGGTGLYIASLLSPMEAMDIPPNSDLRKELSLLALHDLQKKLETVDKKTWESLNNSDRNNPRRLVRKIEIAVGAQGARGQEDRVQGTGDLGQETCVIGLRAPIPVLDGRIDERVDARVKEGAEDEVLGLLSKGYGWDLPAMSGLGYREWQTFFENEKLKMQNEKLAELKQEVLIKWKFNEHAYAKRQMTWFNKQKNIHWFDITDSQYQGEVTRYISAWYTGGNHE